ncbi:MAG: polysaccharide deacetylase family protein [Lachnospiraceae bacterium]|nr:polysaccharide deacetylase family protein [Lachnospiraceae bacterium]
MKKRVLILSISIMIALVVEIIGLYGILKLNKKNSNHAVGNENESNLIKKDIGNEETTETKPEEATQETETETETEEVTEEQPEEIDPNKPMIALTFDDGPSSETTPRLLEALKEQGAHATFFVVGYNLDGNEDIIRQAAEQGCEIGNHTLSHSKLTSLDDASLDSEIGGMEERIKSITGQEVVTIRPPYGAVDDHVMEHIHSPVILWSIDTEDWKTRDVNSNIQSIQQNVYDGAIILMHDIHPESVEAAIQVLGWLKEQGYQLVTISELGYYRRGGLTTGVRYGSIEPN